MAGISDRLREVRHRHDMSLREFAAAVGRVGHPVSHDTVRSYERGRTAAPAPYLLAVSDAFDIDAVWLLTGEDPGEASPDSRVAAASDQALEILQRLASFGHPQLFFDWLHERWQEFSGRLESSKGVRPIIVESWTRSRRAEVPRRSPEPESRRVTDEELSARIAACSALIDTALPHMAWLATLMGDTEWVVCLVCQDGIVLHAIGSSEEQIERWHLAPGHDWSEATMGANGAGTTLVTGKPVAVIGAEHHASRFHECTCLAAPLRGPDEAIVGALDLSTSVPAGRPEWLVLVAYAAWGIERDLAKAG